MKIFHTVAAKPLILALLLSGLMSVLAACHTVAGIGEDVSAAGRAVTNTAEKVKDKL